jgi:hypothetical protein
MCIRENNIFTTSVSSFTNVVKVWNLLGDVTHRQYTRGSQKVKGLLKKRIFIVNYKNGTNITFQRNPPLFHNTGFRISQMF